MIFVSSRNSFPRLYPRRPFGYPTLAVVFSLALLTAGLGCGRKDQPHVAPAEVRIGYFGNLTHAQAVLGVSSGEFASAIEPAKLSTKVFNAGPSLIEAVLAGEVDIGYVGPGPVLNGHLKSRGQGIRVLAGAAENGVLIVARKGSGITRMEDLVGRRIATPQHGNTQDIAARHYVTDVLHQTDSHNVMPIANAEQSAMMSRGEIDAAWAPEPWGSRLIAETGARPIAEEKDLWPGHAFILTLVITTPEFLRDHPEVLRQVLQVHHRWTVRLNNDPQKYIPQLEAALLALNGKKLPKGVLASSIKRVRFVDDPLPDTIRTMGAWAYDLEFAPRQANLATLIDTSILREVVQQ
ncbi:MAG: uptake transporter, periplasmic component [Phycisphaerales bacterium]|nr:uptake transporter, periplasmic component [Phycisphaerales bacterium]